MLTLVTKKITENKKKKAEKAEIPQITKKVKIRDKARKGIIKTTIKIVKVVHNLRQHKTPLINNCLTLALLKTTFTLTV
jgi:hypothetical protein